jgi:hypothetical protein
MSLPRSAREVLDGHVTLDVESIDRLYLNLYVPILQTERGIAFFWRSHRGYDFASSALMAPMSRHFVATIERFAHERKLDVITFTKGQRKEDVAQEYLASSDDQEKVLFIGKAQEVHKVVRTERRMNPNTGASYAWLTMSRAPINQYYFYCFDDDFGPFFIKFSSYFPYNGKVCINGHEYAKRQLAKRGVAFEALENGFLSCENPKALQCICDGLSEKKIEALIRKWFAKLPHPFPPKDRSAGFRYEISIIQAEMARTQVFDRPLSGRVFFDDVIRHNLDLGRPEQAQLIFDRRILRKNKQRFRTRVITHGVIPSLHIDFKSSRIKQYFKGGRALRTETVINNTLDFGVRKKLPNLPELREVGFQANRRLLDVQRISSDCWIAEEQFDRLTRPQVVGSQRAPALRFGDHRAMALLAALLVFHLLPRGFRNRDLRDHVAPLLGCNSEQMTQGKVTYDLRRLRLHGLIERSSGYRYRVTDLGFRAASFFLLSYGRLLRPASAAFACFPNAPTRQLERAFQELDAAVRHLWEDPPMVA